MSKYSSESSAGAVVIGTPLDQIEKIHKDVRDTFDEGVTKPLSWRLNQLKALVALLTENETAIKDAIKKDLRADNFMCHFEINTGVDDANNAIKNLKEWMTAESVPLPAIQLPGAASVHKEPYGIVLLISPWNYPVELITRPLVGAIAAGNCVVIKPSEISANVANTFAELAPKYFDRRAIRVVQGAVAETTALLKLKWDHIMYTGNGTVGRIVMKAAAEHLTPVTLELGGKSPVIIDQGTNMDVAINRIVWGKFMNVGQTCIAPDYVLCHRDLEQTFIQLFKATVEKFYSKNPKENKEYGKIITPRHTERLSKLLEGEKILHGGEVDIEKCYIAPTLVGNPSVDSKIMNEEIFGPILPILSVSSVDEAIKFINKRPKPLALYVFTPNKATADKVINSTSSGAVTVNEVIMHIACPCLPFGGVGESGMGAYNGKRSFDTFSHDKAILRRTQLPDPSFRFPPYTQGKVNLISRLDHLLGQVHITNPFKYFGGFKRVVFLLGMFSLVVYLTKDQLFPRSNL